MLGRSEFSLFYPNQVDYSIHKGSFPNIRTRYIQPNELMIIIFSLSFEYDLFLRRQMSCNLLNTTPSSVRTWSLNYPVYLFRYAGLV